MLCASTRHVALSARLRESEPGSSQSPSHTSATQVFEHPYKPWQSVAKEHAEGAEAAYRAFRAYENSKEWAVLTIPSLWIFSVYASALPFVSPTVGAVTTASLAAVYCVGDKLYASGYGESAEGRMKGFKIRTLAFRGIAYGAIAGVVGAAYLSCVGPFPGCLQN